MMTFGLKRDMALSDESMTSVELVTARRPLRCCWSEESHEAQHSERDSGHFK